MISSNWDQRSLILDRQQEQANTTDENKEWINDGWGAGGGRQGDTGEGNEWRNQESEEGAERALGTSAVLTKVMQCRCGEKQTGAGTQEETEQLGTAKDTTKHVHEDKTNRTATNLSSYTDFIITHLTALYYY